MGPVPGQAAVGGGMLTEGSMSPLHGEKLVLALPEAVGGLEAAGLPYPHVPPVSFQDLSRDGERRLPTAAGDSVPGTPPRLVRVTARRTEAPASVCSLVLSSRSALPQVSLHAPHAASNPASLAGSWR